MSLSAATQCGDSRGDLRRLPRFVRAVSVAEVLATPALRGRTVLAGRMGFGRTVERLTLQEQPAALRGASAHELLLTTEAALRSVPGDLHELIVELDDRGLAALAVRRGPHAERLPVELLAEADRRGLPVIQVPDHLPWDDILEQILTGLLNRQTADLARSETAHRSLAQLVLDGGDVSEVANELATLLDAAVVITRPDGAVLADGGNPAWLSPAYKSRCFDASGRLRPDADALAAPAGAPSSHVIVPVRSGRVEHGRIAVFSPDGALRPADIRTVERAATVVALVVTRQLAVRAVDTKYHSDVLRDLLTNRISADQAAHQAASTGWDLQRPVIVVVSELDPATRPDEPAVVSRSAVERFALAWQNAVRSLDRAAPVVGFHREVVALLGAPADVDIARIVAELVATVTRDTADLGCTFSTGIGRVAEVAARIPAGYAQAITAVRVGRRTQGAGALAQFDTLGVFRLLSLVEDRAQLRSFATETLGELAVEDSHGDAAELRRTLEVLLETNLNVAETARLLHFHYNTLRYRIAKLERIVGPFTRDPQLRLSLQLALQVLQMRGV